MKHAKKTALGQEIIASLKGGVDYARGKIELRSNAAELPGEPPKMSKRTIKDIRKQLHVSQSVLARYLGVSASVIRAWEQGQSTPNGSASRLLQIAAARPKAFMIMVAILGREEEAAYYQGIEAFLVREAGRAP